MRSVIPDHTSQLMKTAMMPTMSDFTLCPWLNMSPKPPASEARSTTIADSLV